MAKAEFRKFHNQHALVFCFSVNFGGLIELFPDLWASVISTNFPGKFGILLRKSAARDLALGIMYLGFLPLILGSESLLISQKPWSLRIGPNFPIGPKA